MGVLARAAVLLLFVTACDEHEVDARFATPEATLQTLLASYGVQHMSQDEIQEHMRARGRFELRDEQTFRACFDDYSSAADEGLAGFVFGTVAAGKDDLRVNHAQGKAHVFPDPDRRERRVVLVEHDGEWKISLRDSVPPAIRRSLREEYQRLSDRVRREGATR